MSNTASTNTRRDRSAWEQLMAQHGADDLSVFVNEVDAFMTQCNFEVLGMIGYDEKGAGDPGLGDGHQSEATATGSDLSQ